MNDKFQIRVIMIPHTELKLFLPVTKLKQSSSKLRAFSRISIGYMAAVVACIILVITSVTLYLVQARLVATPKEVETKEFELFELDMLPLRMSEKPRQINSVSLNTDTQSLILGVRGILLYNSSYAEVSTEFDTLFHVCIEGGGCLNPGVYASVDEDDESMQATIQMFTPTSSETTDRRRLLRIYFGRKGSKRRFYVCILCKFAGCKRNWGKSSCVRILAVGWDVDKK